MTKPTDPHVKSAKAEYPSHRRILQPLFCLCTLLFLAAGCAVGPNYRRPAVDSPATFRGETHTSSSDVVMVYDSVRSGKRAKELCDRLGQQLAPDCELNLSVSSLSELQLLPPLARAAARETERTNLLIVAVNGDKTLPRPIKSFLHRCAGAIRAADGALVAQLHGILRMNEKLDPAYGCLTQIAHHSGIRFFSEVVELPDDELNYSLDAIHERAHRRTPAVAAVLQRPQNRNPELL